MTAGLSRRAFAAGTTAAPAMPAFYRRAQAEDALLLRCSLDTVPSHARNASIKDYLHGVEAGSNGRIKTQLFESGQLFRICRSVRHFSKIKSRWRLRAVGQ
jgi:C4-dicarboxylate-binding protein DctP